MILRDFLGNEIRVGDRVVYPVRKGSSLWLVQGTVEIITLKEGEPPALKVRRVVDEEYLDKLVTIYALDRVVVVP